ncbi:MAG: hypothetical protein JO320_14020 [Alphaproteobacteria bacterium]|nr:hypothetical protein [Alphaproteobacteria bacterium]
MIYRVPRRKLADTLRRKKGFLHGWLSLETFVELALVYLAVGAVLFALIPGRAMPSDFHWRNQIGVFRDSLPEVLGWPLALWRMCRQGRFFD